MVSKTPVSEPSVKKVIRDKKTGQTKKVLEIKRNFRAVPLEKLALVCESCGYEHPLLKIKVYSPRFCPHCGMVLQLRLIGNLSHICYSEDLENLRIADKFKIERIK